MLFLFFIFGLLIGSFLNVCIYRFPRGESVVGPPSHCPQCDQRLRAMDLVPIFSYLWQKGKCRYCGVKISPRYLLVEGLTGILFVLTFLIIGFNIVLLKYLVLFSVLIVISFIDLDYMIIPDRLVLFIFLWGFVWQIFAPQISWGEALGGALLGGGFLLLVTVLSGGGMGGGDVKLLLAAGFYLGPVLTGLALFISVLVGGLVGLGLILLKIKKRKDPIPFGPFLCLGILAATLWGAELIRWYVTFLN